MISVIVPIYNSEDTIKRCIDSILDQKYEDYEVILVDDGSTDSTSQIVDSYKNDRVHVIHTPNLGVSHARNIGIRNSQGDWITFIDADDYVTPSYLSSLDDGDYDYIALSYCDRDEWGNMLHPITHENIAKEIETIQDTVDLVHTDAYIFVWGKRFKRNIIIEHSIFFDEELRYAEDIVFMHKYALKVKNYKLKSEICLSHVIYERDTLSDQGINDGFPKKTVWREYSSEIFKNIPELKNEFERQQLYFLELEIVKLMNKNIPYSEKVKKIKEMFEHRTTKKCLNAQPGYFNTFTDVLVKKKLYWLLAQRYAHAGDMKGK